MIEEPVVLYEVVRPVRSLEAADPAVVLSIEEYSSDVEEHDLLEVSRDSHRV